MTFNNYKDILSLTNFTVGAAVPLPDYLKPNGTGDNAYGYIQNGTYFLTYTFAETALDVESLSYGGALGVSSYYGLSSAEGANLLDIGATAIETAVNTILADQSTTSY